MALSVAHQPSENNSQETNNPITHMHSYLYKAAADGEIDFFKRKKEHELVDLLTPNKNTVLHIHITAFKTDRTLFVEEILKLGPALLMQPNAKGEIPLHIAARYGHVRIVEFLIECAKDDQHDDHDQDRLIEITGTPSTNAVQQMLRWANKENDTSLHEAVRFRHLQVVRMLTKEDPEFIHFPNEAGETPLYIAAERGYGDLVHEILENCSSPATGGPNGRTVLHAATIAKDKGEILKKLEHLDLTKQADEQGWIPLHHAAKLDCVEVLALLLKGDKYTAYIQNKKGMTALHIAASHGNYKTMKELIRRCPDSSEMVDKRGWNALHFAVEGHKDIAVDVIIENSSLRNLINEKDSHGNTPFLQMASSLNYTRSLFFNKRVDKMAFNKKNQNALDIVSTSKKVNFFKNFVKEGLHMMGIRPGRRVPIHEKGDIEEERKIKSGIQNTIPSGTLVAATLIATVTFVAGFTFPGVYLSDEGPHEGVGNTAFQAFMISDTIALVLSGAAVFTNLFMTLINMFKNDVSRIRRYHFLSFFLTMLAMGAMLIAFITGTYAVLAHNSLPLAIATSAIGLFFLIFFYRLCKRIPSF